MTKETIINIIVLIVAFDIGVLGFRFSKIEKDPIQAKIGLFLGFIGAFITTFVLYNMLT